MQTVHIGLDSVAQVLVLAEALASLVDLAFEIRYRAFEFGHARADFPQAFFALDHAAVRVRIPRYAQPIAAQPNSVAGHHRFAAADLPLHS
jgi:hypothetical protein